VGGKIRHREACSQPLAVSLPAPARFRYRAGPASSVGASFTTLRVSPQIQEGTMKSSELLQGVLLAVVVAVPVAIVVSLASAYFGVHGGIPGGFTGAVVAVTVAANRRRRAEAERNQAATAPRPGA
jgi:hypothetical protein